MSSDSVDSHQKFTQQYQLPFILLSDEDSKLSTLFGVASSLFGLLSGRVTYVVDKNGIVQLVYKNVFAANHIAKVLEALKETVSQN